MLLAKALRETHWQPTIGDPTVLGWLTAVCYGLAALACLVCWHRRSRLIDQARQKRFGLFWLLLGLAMAVLAINKQLDLQGLVHATGRNMAIRQGWFDRRHEAERIVLIAVGVIGLLSVGVILLVMRGLWLRVRLSVCGVALLAGFAVLRTAELLSPGRISQAQLVGPIYVSHALELVAVAVVIVGAVQCVIAPKTDRLSASHGPA